MVLTHICQNHLQDFPVFCHPQRTVCISNDTVGSACIKTGNQIAFFIRANGNLRLIPIMKPLIHPLNRFHTPAHQCFRKTTDSDQIISDLILFKFQLLLIRQGLKLAATALPMKTAHWLYTKRRRHKYLLQTGIAITCFQFCNSGLYTISNHSILDKQRKTIHLADAFPLCPHIFYIQDNPVIFFIIHRSVPPAPFSLFTPDGFFVHLIQTTGYSRASRLPGRP